jgi:hypothetical protein
MEAYACRPISKCRKGQKGKSAKRYFVLNRRAPRTPLAPDGTSPLRSADREPLAMMLSARTYSTRCSVYTIAGGVIPIQSFPLGK